jgi:hypothetical protein
MKDSLEEIYRIAFNAINQIDECKQLEKEVDVNSLREAFTAIVAKICKEREPEG